MQLENDIRNALARKEILLMTHIVLGYPSFEVNEAVIAQMVQNGVDLIEMQIPFSEPMADGPVILRANQQAIASGVKVRACLDFAARIIDSYKIPFLFMTYYNILFKFGEQAFIERSQSIGIKGLIVPDLPPEEGATYLASTKQHGIAPILIFSPTSTDERLKTLAQQADGFVYCVARKGVTGRKTSFDQGIDSYLARCHRATNLPLAVGFGIRSREDVAYLKGKSDIAVVGSETLRLVDSLGAEAVGPFIADLVGA